MSELLIRSIEIAAIKDAGAQMRVEISADIVEEYAVEMTAGAAFPPVIVFKDEGGVLWLGDGYHRLAAAVKAGLTAIEAEVRKGTSRDSILFGAGANASHGLRRTQEDKRRAVVRLLTDPEWAQWSDRKIAKLARVDHKTVGKIRRELTGKTDDAVAKFDGGEIPTTRPKKPNGGGEIPTRKSGSVVDALLATLSDDALAAECERRSWRVERDA